MNQKWYPHFANFLTDCCVGALSHAVLVQLVKLDFVTVPSNCVSPGAGPTHIGHGESPPEQSLGQEGWPLHWRVAGRQRVPAHESVEHRANQCTRSLHRD